MKRTWEQADSGWNGGGSAQASQAVDYNWIAQQAFEWMMGGPQASPASQWNQGSSASSWDQGASAAQGASASKWDQGPAASKWDQGGPPESKWDQGPPASKWDQGPGSTSPAKPTFQRAFIPNSEEDLEKGIVIELKRQELKVSVEGGAKGQAPIGSFEELGVLPNYVLKALAETGRQSPMPIQAQALPIILSGHDLIGIAKTGSGKTLAFLLPAIVHIEPQRPPAKEDATPIALILAPTRELVAQIAEEAGKLCEHSAEGAHPRGIWAQEVFGGKQRQMQLTKSRGASIIAATPGRLSDFVNNGDMSLDRVTYFALDEADRMLDMGFQGDMENFSGRIRPERHTLFFSATWPKTVQDLASNLCHKGQLPVILRVGQKDDGAGASRADIVQKVVVFDEYDWGAREKRKQTLLYGHIREVLAMPGTKMLVFVSSKVLADEVSTKLNSEGFSTDCMHGGRKQWDRDEVLAKFKRDEFRLLVATDVMGRGLDIPTITHVVIYDMGDVDDYIHRIGRTARGHTERLGNALTLFEYNRKWPELAGGLVKVLEDSQQEVPPELRQIAEQVANGTRDIVDRNQVLNKPSKSQRDKLANQTSADRQYDSSGKPICKFFLEGVCTKAAWCPFSHGDAQPGAAAQVFAKW